MKQKTRFENIRNIGYQSMNGQYIGIGPKKLYRSISKKTTFPAFYVG